MTGERCQSMRVDGSPCGSTALPGRTRCFAHDPDNAPKARAARSKGAKAANVARALRRKQAVLSDLDTLAGFMSAVIVGTLAGKYNERIAKTTLYGAGLLRQVLVDSDVEERLKALEAQVLPKANRWA